MSGKGGHFTRPVSPAIAPVTAGAVLKVQQLPVMRIGLQGHCLLEVVQSRGALRLANVRSRGKNEAQAECIAYTHASNVVSAVADCLYAVSLIHGTVRVRMTNAARIRPPYVQTEAARACASMRMMVLCNMSGNRPPLFSLAARIANSLDLLKPGKDWRTEETLLLLSLLDLVMTDIEVAQVSCDQEAASTFLMRAVDTYGQVKTLLPKLDLEKEQKDLVREGMETVRQRLWPDPMKPGGKR